MKSTKLSRDLRNRIKHAYVEKTMMPRNVDLARKRVAIADRIYDHFFGAINVIEIPKSFTKIDATLRMLKTKGSMDHLRLSGERIQPRGTAYGDSVCKQDDLPKALNTAYEQLLDAQKGLEKDERTLANEVMSVLTACSSSKKLLEGWPEEEKFLREFFPAQDCTELSVTTKNLMAMSKSLAKT